MREEWRDVPGWAGHYQVSDAGRVRSLSRLVGARGGSLALRPGRVLTPVAKGGRYFAVTLARGDERKQCFVHDLVLDAFVGPKPKGLQVCHADDDRTNNALVNLRYGSPKENDADARRNGKKAIGQRHGMAKLTEDQVSIIRAAPESNAYLAELFNVTASHIWRIRERQVWKHI